MTILFQADHLPPTSAQTHALLIGVGRYPYVLHSKTGLTPLTSPAASVRALANWLLQPGLHNPAAPLGSVEVLLSALDAADQHFELADGSSLALDAATWPNIRRTFDRWLQRCNQQPANVAIFYFCGHGLQKEQTLSLLLENFGQTQANEWADTINFTETYAGLRSTCRAQTQCYVIDACRQVDLAMLHTGPFSGQALCKGDALSRNNPATLTLFTAESGAIAFAEAHQTSRLTAVLLQALQTSDQPDGKIDLATLARRTAQLMDAANQSLPRDKHQRTTPELVGDTSLPLHYTMRSACAAPMPLALTTAIPPAPTVTLSPADEQFLRDQLAQHEQNRRTLLKQKAIYGAGEAPLRLLNQLEAEEQSIQKTRQQLGEVDERGDVLGLNSHQHGKGNRESTAALEKIWPDMSLQLRTQASPISRRDALVSGNPLMNFEEELRAFEQIAAGQDRDTHLILIQGISGMGKSRLLAEYQALADQYKLDILPISLGPQLTVIECLDMLVYHLGSQYFHTYDQLYNAGLPEPFTRAQEEMWQRNLTRHFFADLAQRADAPPLAVFFDQYEKADPTFKKWVEHVFVSAIFRHQLTVVISGQETIQQNSGWRGQRHFSLNGVKLDWYHWYAQICNVKLETELIKQFHLLLGGRPKEFVDYVQALRAQVGAQ